MREWDSPLNPFNSLKILMYPEHLRGCATENYLPPITVAIDPTNRCNFDCEWCNAARVRGMEKSEMSSGDIRDIVALLKVWGVKSNCIAGGGEPFMNPHTPELIERCKAEGISNSIITNGSLLNDETIKLIASSARWIGFSMDAGTPSTFAKLKRVPESNFSRILWNIRHLRDEIDRTKSACEIGFKYLLHPENQMEIEIAISLARNYGAHDFQMRPVSMAGKIEYSIDAINEQIANGMNFQTEKFRVYAIQHKSTDQFKAKFNFRNCRACAVHPVLCPDGTLQLCIDRRGDPDLILCNWRGNTEEVLLNWNSEKHRAILRNVDLKTCKKCTFSGYNEIIEKVFQGDAMCRSHV